MRGYNVLLKTHNKVKNIMKYFSSEGTGRSETREEADEVARGEDVEEKRDLDRCRNRCERNGERGRRGTFCPCFFPLLCRGAKHGPMSF